MFLLDPQTPKFNQTVKKYYFKGMVCFWGSHYFAYFRDFECKDISNYWHLYDDHRVIKIGDWDDVIERCMKGHEKPILLIFEKL